MTNDLTKVDIKNMFEGEDLKMKTSSESDIITPPIISPTLTKEHINNSLSRRKPMSLASQTTYNDES